MSKINEVIRKRRSVYPMQFIDKPVSREILEELLLNANHAPTHRLTEPWRFKVFTGLAKIRLGEFLNEKYQATTSNQDPSKMKKIRTNTEKAGAILAIILHRDTNERVPEWEEIAAVSCAVQNIWLALDQYGLGGYWSSPSLSNFLGEFISLEKNEKCLGFFYMGFCEPSDRISIKKPIEQKVQWFDE